MDLLRYVRSAGLEPAAFRSGGGRSIHWATNACDPWRDRLRVADGDSLDGEDRWSPPASLRGVSVVLAPLAPCPVDTPLRVL